MDCGDLDRCINIITEARESGGLIETTDSLRTKESFQNKGIKIIRKSKPGQSPKRKRHVQEFVFYPNRQFFCKLLNR